MAALCCPLLATPAVTGLTGFLSTEMELQSGVNGFRLSNQPVLLLCPLQASLEVLQRSIVILP